MYKNALVRIYDINQQDILKNFLGIMDMVDFIVLYAETIRILRLYTVIYVVCIMIYFFEIYE